MNPALPSGARRIAVVTALCWNILPTIALVVGFAEARRDKTGIGPLLLMTFGLGALVASLVISVAIAAVAVGNRNPSRARAIVWGTLGPFLAWAFAALVVLAILYLPRRTY